MVEDIGKIISNGFETYTKNLNLSIPFVLNVVITGLLLVIIVILTASNVTAGYHPFFWKNRQSRQQEAREWLAEYKKLNAQIPTLSPAEQRWLKTEYDDEISRNGGHFTKRALDAGASKEFALRSTKPHIERIIGILSELSGPNIHDQRNEVILWARLVSLYMAPEFWQDIEELVRRGIINKEINGVKELYGANGTGDAKAILDNIVIAYFNGDLGK